MNCLICRSPINPKYKEDTPRKEHESWEKIPGLVCDHCFEHIPSEIQYLAEGSIKPAYVDKYWYRPDNWYLYPEVVSRLGNIKEPMHVRILRPSNHKLNLEVGDTLKLGETDPRHNRILVVGEKHPHSWVLKYHDQGLSWELVEETICQYNY